MTVSTTQNRSAQNGNGVTLVFNFPYLFLENDDLLVYVDNVLKTLTTDYSVTGAGGVGVAAVTFLVAPAVGVGNVVIINDPDRLQATALPSNGPFPSASVERMADKLTLIVQRMYDLITRSLRLSDSDPSTVSTQLPSTAGNGTKVLRMNAAETALEYVDPGSVALAVPADASVTAAKLAAAAVTAAKLAASALGFTLINGTLVPSVNAGALTIAIKTKAGTDPTAADPVQIVFRNTTAATGDYSLITLIAATSFTLSAGSTMGATNNIAFRLWLVGFNDAGTFRMGAVNCLSGTSIMPLRDDILASSTIEGGAGAADSAQVIYTGVAVAAKAMRILGYIEWSAGLAAVGTYGIVPTKVQHHSAGNSLPGQVVQIVRADTGAVLTGTTVIPYDDTIPQITEGDQYMTQAITPTSAANLLDVLVSAQTTVSAANYQSGAIFQDATANALVAAQFSGADSAVVKNNRLSKKMLAGGVVATTFRFRAGGQAGTMTFNGTGGARLYGGVFNSFMEVTEIMA